MVSIKTTTILLCLSWLPNLLAQQPWVNRFSAALEYRGKSDLFCKTPDCVPVAAAARAPVFRNVAALLRYRFHERASVETGYWKEPFFVYFTLSPFAFLRYKALAEVADMVPLRIQVDAIKTNVLKRPLRVSSSVGTVLGLSRNQNEQRYGWEGESADAGNYAIVYNSGHSDILDLTRVSRYRMEHGLKHRFMLLEGRLETSYEVLPGLVLYGGGGYTLGTRPIGRIRVNYTVNMGPTETVALETKGSSMAWFVGVRLGISGSGSD